MPWLDLDTHLAEAFAVHPSRIADAEHVARRGHLARRRSAQDTYRAKGKHVAVCRQWRARQPQSIAATCRRVWREVRQQRREDARLRWHRREAVAWVLAEIRA